MLYKMSPPPHFFSVTLVIQMRLPCPRLLLLSPFVFPKLPVASADAGRELSENVEIPFKAMITPQSIP